MRRRIVLASLVVTLLLVWGAVPALARDYAIGRFYDGNTYGGGSVTMQVQCVTTPNPGTGNHINQTMWVDTDYTNQYTANLYWVEEGYTYGYHGTTSGYNCGLLYYYARNSSTYGYQDWAIYTPVTSTGGYDVYSIEQDIYNSCAYVVWLNGAKLTSVGGQCPWTMQVDVGLEYTETTSTVPAIINSYNHGLRTRACCTWGPFGSSTTINTWTHFFWWVVNWTNSNEQN